MDKGRKILLLAINRLIESKERRRILHSTKSPAGGIRRGSETVWLIVCLLGMAVHNVYVTIGYSKYITTTEVLITYEDEIILPALSVCFRNDEIRKKDSFHPNHPCRKNFSAASVPQCESDLHFNHTILKVMSEFTLNLSKNNRFFANWI